MFSIHNANLGGGIAHSFLSISHVHLPRLDLFRAISTSAPKLGASWSRPTPATTAVFADVDKLQLVLPFSVGLVRWVSSVSYILGPVLHEV